MDPKFSIIVPAHNSSRFIAKCLNSIEDQVFDRSQYELIIVCDACTDDTWKIAMEYADTVLTTDFGNDGPPRSAGLDVARGEWILFLDDDDWWMHEYTLDIIDQHLSDGIDILLFGFIFATKGYAAPIRENNGIWPAVWNKCYRRTFISGTPFHNIQPTPEGDAPDIDWTRRIIKLGPRLATLDMPLYYYNYGRAGSQTVEKVWRKP